MKKLILAAVFCAIGCAIFHFGGWHMVLDKKITVVEQLIRKGVCSEREMLEMLVWDKQSNLLLDENNVLVRVNKSYYGFVRDRRYFDSPVIQWIMLFASFGAFFAAAEVFFESEEEES